VHDGQGQAELLGIPGDQLRRVADVDGARVQVQHLAHGRGGGQDAPCCGGAVDSGEDCVHDSLHPDGVRLHRTPLAVTVAGPDPGTSTRIGASLVTCSSEGEAPTSTLLPWCFRRRRN
jgi:hypothetical protein